MDIEKLERQIRELQEWKDRVAPMLEAQLPEWDKYKAGLSDDDGEEDEEEERARIVREADEIRAADAKREEEERKRAELMKRGQEPQPPQQQPPQTGADAPADAGVGLRLNPGGTTDKVPEAGPNQHGLPVGQAAPGGTTETQPNPFEPDPERDNPQRRREEETKERKEEFAERTGVRSKEGMPTHEGIAGQEPKHNTPPGNTTERNPPGNPQQK